MQPPDQESMLMREQLTDLQYVTARVDANVENIVSRMEDLSGRLDAHADRISLTETQVERWKAQESLVVGIASFVGIGGFASMVAVAIKLYSR